MKSSQSSENIYKVLSEILALPEREIIQNTFCLSESIEKDEYLSLWTSFNKCQTSQDKQTIIEQCNHTCGDDENSCFAFWLFYKLLNESESNQLVETFCQLHELGLNLQVDDLYIRSFLEVAILHRALPDFFMFLLHVVNIKITPQQYLLSMAYLDQYLNNSETYSWASEIKKILDEYFPNFLASESAFSYQFLMNTKNKALCVLPDDPNTFQISCLNPITHVIDSLFLLKNATASLWEAPRNLKFSPLSLAVQLECPTKLFQIIFSDSDFHEQPSHVSLHAWFTIQRIKSKTNPEWYAEVFQFLTNYFSSYTHYDGSLLHYLIEHKQLSKIKEHQQLLMKHLESTNSSKQTPLIMACGQSNEYVELLFTMKPNLLHQDNKNTLAIHHLIQSPHICLAVKALKECKHAKEIGLPIYTLLHADLAMIEKIDLELTDFFKDSEIDLEQLLKIYISSKTHEHLLFIHKKFNLFENIHFFNSYLSLAIHKKQWTIANFLLQSSAFNFGEPCQLQPNKKLAELMFGSSDTLQLIAQQQLISRFPDMLMYCNEQGEPAVNQILEMIKVPSNRFNLRNIFIQMFKALDTVPELFPNWLGFTEHFFDFLNFAIMEKIINIDDLVGNKQSILYYYDQFLTVNHKNFNYHREMSLFYSFFSPNINLKNAQHQHMIIILSKLPQAVTRLSQFISAFHQHQVQLVELNPEQDNMLDVCEELNDPNFSLWCFKTLKDKLSNCLEKTHTIVKLFRQSPKICVDLLRHSKYAISDFFSQLNTEQHADVFLYFNPPARVATPIIATEEEPEPDDEKQCIETLSASPQPILSTQSTIQFDWTSLIQFLKDSNLTKIKELKLECYHQQLQDLFASNDIYQLFCEVLLEKPQNYTYQFCRISAVSPYSSKILHDCILQDNLKLFSRLIEIKLFQKLFTKNIQEYLVLMLKQSSDKSKILDSYLEQNTLQTVDIHAPNVLIQVAIENQRWLIIEQLLPMLNQEQKSHILASHYAYLEQHGKLDLFEIETKVENKVIRCISPPEPMLQQFSMFSKAKTHAVAIATIPEFLLTMTKAIHEKFQQPCFLTGSAVTNLYLDKPHQSDYDCLVFNVELKDIQSFLCDSMHIQCQIVGKKHPILKINYNHLDIEFSKASGSAEKIDALMFQRDFNLAGLYINLNQASDSDLLEISDPCHSFESIDKKQISVLGLRDSIFEEDPIRLFRLIKIKLQYPGFELDDHLIHLMANFNIEQCLIRYVLDDDRNASHIGTKLENLFFSYPLNQVLNCLHQFGILSAIIPADPQLIRNTIPLLERYLNRVLMIADVSMFKRPPAYKIKLGLYCLTLAFYCLNHDKEENLEDWPFYRLLSKIMISDRHLYQIIKNYIWESHIEHQYSQADLYSLLHELQSLNLQSACNPTK
jgi:tRNA nucleotidyltransferase/poly(A) polymerase